MGRTAWIGIVVMLLVIVAWWAMSPPVVEEPVRFERVERAAPAKRQEGEPMRRPPSMSPVERGDKVCVAKRTERLTERVDEILNADRAKVTSHGVVRLRDMVVVPAELLEGDVAHGLRFTYATSDRDVVGFRITSVSPSGVGAALSLAPGDVVGEINDVVLTGNDTVTAAWQAIRRDRRGCAAIWRAGTWQAHYWVAH